MKQFCAGFLLGAVIAGYLAYDYGKFEMDEYWVHRDWSRMCSIVEKE